jgi:5-methylcytosine-specific restriction protein A
MGMEDEIAMAERSEIDRRIRKLIEQDLAGSAMEGLTAEQCKKVRLRAAWLAQKFAKQRRDAGLLICEDCLFDPAVKALGTGVNPRSLLDVHHKRPLDEGVRYTSVMDFALLCPTCHRFAHRASEAARTRLIEPKPLSGGN